jgi:hypothetical protein
MADAMYRRLHERPYIVPWQARAGKLMLS